jgi:hypothetical protein
VFDNAFSTDGAFSTVSKTSARIFSDEVNEVSADNAFPVLDVMFSSAPFEVMNAVFS